MTKTELQVALAEATQTDKKTAGAFLNALGRYRLQSGQKGRRVCAARFWQADQTETRRPHGL
jgi:hypothetical protein